MPNILVTGGTGFLGKRVVRSLVRQGHQVQLLLREQSDLSGVQAFIPMEHHAQLKACYGFRDDGARLNAALQECISVIHLAVCSSGFRARMLHENMELTRKLAEAIAKTALPRLVHVSSLGVYGELPANSTLDEESPLEQHPERRDSYTHSKLAQEKILKEIEARQNLRVCVMRPGVIIGPGRGALSPRMGQTFGKRHFIFGNRTLPYTYVDNCAEAIMQASLMDQPAGSVFNIVDDQLPTVDTVLESYRHWQKPLRAIRLPMWTIPPLAILNETLHGLSLRKLPLVLSRYRVAAFYRPLQFTNRRAKQQLGWQPLIPMQEALRRAILNVEA